MTLHYVAYYCQYVPVVQTIHFDLWSDLESYIEDNPNELNSAWITGNE